MAGERVRWGVLGAATIAREAFIPALRKGPCAGVAELVALASRDGQRAEQLASELQIPRAYGSYEELLAAPDIDAVYIPLPNHLHVPFAIQALEHGKHVLCEKPLALTADEAHSLLAATARFPRLKVMEAFMYRFHPQWQWVFRNVQENRLGRLRSIQTHFSFFDDNPTSILHRAEWGGGALMDIGCYPISLSRWLLGQEPRQVWGELRELKPFGVERVAIGLLDFGEVTSVFTSATNVAPHQSVHLYGERGHLGLTLPFNPPTDRPTYGSLEVDGTATEIEFPICDQYAIQAESFSQAILRDTPVPTPLNDGVANMRIVDALRRSSEQGTWERC